MKKSIFIFYLMLMASSVYTQNQIDAFIKEAQGYIAQKNYKQAQMSLQDAIAEINNIFAKQLVESLPAEVNGLKADDGEVNVNTAAMGVMGGGIQITKTYRHPTKKENEVELDMLTNSPMLNAMNMFLTNPGMLGQGQKSIRVGSRRAIIKSDQEDYTDEKGITRPIQVSEIQIPLSQTLVTFKTRGFATEQDAISFAAKFDLDKIKTLLGE
ncbi:MAG: hypothetical protein IPL56_09760 [Saprospiraceae bacterium]|nr:hypothetical protein [Saprospiraceae bacterium]